MARSDRRRDEALGAPGTERLLTLTDGVVAIALTLLVARITVPTVQGGTGSSSALGRALWHELPEITTYVVSFYVIAQFWLVHHRVYRLIVGHSESVAWWNFLFLFTITLFPFTAGLLAAFPDNVLATDLFALNLLAASFATTAVVYVARHRQLLDGRVTPEMVRRVRTRGMGIAAVILASIAVSFVSTDWAKYLWLAMIVVAVLSERAA